jgi:adenine-specific DNA-methyltransferase
MTIQKLRPSFTFTQDRLAELQAVIPEAFADGRIDWDALKEALGTFLEDEGPDSEQFGLFWPGKREARRLAAMPSKGTLQPAPGEGVNEVTTGNIFIEGDNLEVQKLLLKSYAGRVKMIYIDPPYNTGNDFIYKDNFWEPLEDYLRKTGQADEEGNLLTTNTRADGRFHSNWLNMMYPRLRLARQLLKDDGVIFISIDDHEVYNLRLIMNEVFGEENFLATFVWRRRASSALADKLVSVDHEYVVAYQRGGFKSFFGKQKDYANYRNPDNDPNGDWTLGDLTVGMTKEQRPNQFYDLVEPITGRLFPANPNRVWAFIQESMDQQIAAGRVVFPEDNNKRPMVKRYKKNLKSEVNPISTWIKSLSDSTESLEITELETGLNAEGTRLIQELFGATVFNYSKPISLIISLMKHCTSNDDIVLDLFAGSCATAQAVLELNHMDGGDRRFVMLQLPEPTDNLQLPTIAEIGKKRIHHVIDKIMREDLGILDLSNRENQEDLGFKVFKLSISNFKVWQDYQGEDVQEIETLFDDIETPLIEGWSEAGLLTEILLIQGFPLDSIITRQDEFKQNNIQLVESDAYTQRLFVCLDERIDGDTIAQLQLRSEDVFVCLDSALTDQSKMRVADICNLNII